MERRLFIAINLPEDVRARIRDIVLEDTEHTAELYENARMMDEDSWHITLKFLGEQMAESIDDIMLAIADAMTHLSPPEIAIRTLTTAPPHRPPRMVWLTTTTETNQTLEPLKQAIERNLETRHIVQKGEIFPAFTGHITLARLPEGRKFADHVVSLPSSLTFRPTSIDLMESRLESSGARYRTIKSIDFKPSV